MARINKKAPRRPPISTHQGGPATHIPNKLVGMGLMPDGKVVKTTIDRPLERLRRSVLACLLWEDTFYESGKKIAERIDEAADRVSLSQLADLTIEARTHYNLRSAPMLLLSKLVERAALEKMSVVQISKQNIAPISLVVSLVIQRADELTELVAMYWRNGKRKLTAQLKKGLALAFQKFDAYQLGKYDRKNAVRLRDVMFLTHPKPKDDEQAAVWKKLAANELEPPDTWEVALSAGKDAKETFERLLREGKLGYMALLRNLRNMEKAKVDSSLVTDAILARKGAHRVLPFRFVAAARAVPSYEAALDRAMIAGLSELPALPGLTAVLVDVSGSMDNKLSRKNWKTGIIEQLDLTMMDSAATLASIIPAGSFESPNKLRVFTFSTRLVEVPPRRGMAGVDAVKRSQEHGSTYLAQASRELAARVEYDRLIVVTDEQSQDGSAVLRPGAKGYLINVAPYENGVNYSPNWVHLTGFSENIIRFISEYEKMDTKMDTTEKAG